MGNWTEQERKEYLFMRLSMHKIDMLRQIAKDNHLFDRLCDELDDVIKNMLLITLEQEDNNVWEILK